MRKILQDNSLQVEQNKATSGQITSMEKIIILKKKNGTKRCLKEITLNKSYKATIQCGTNTLLETCMVHKRETNS